MVDYYQVLGVKKDASADEIKQAYRKMAKEHHPDLKGGDKQAERRFSEINVAYETLSDDAKRKAYDEERANPFSSSGNRTYTWKRAPSSGQGDPFSEFTGGGSGTFNVDDILGDLFGTRAGRPRRSLDVVMKRDITPWEAALGGKLEVRFRDKTLSVKIPKGAVSGQKLRLRGQGSPDGEGSAGDLVIELTIQNPKRITPELLALYEKMAKLVKQ